MPDMGQNAWEERLLGKTSTHQAKSEGKTRASLLAPIFVSSRSPRWPAHCARPTHHLSDSFCTTRASIVTVMFPHVKQSKSHTNRSHHLRSHVSISYLGPVHSRSDPQCASSPQPFSLPFHILTNIIVLSKGHSYAI